MSAIICFVIVVGLGSTIAIDLWALALNKLLGIPNPNWGMIGRWVVGLTRGRFFLRSPENSQPTSSETIIGWSFHYAVGLFYAALLLLISGQGYVTNPTVIPPILVGVIIATLAGSLILIPAMGGGIFATKLPTPGKVIGMMTLSHIIFASAQYGSAWINLSL